MDYLNVLIRTTIFYFFVVFAYRLMGKREVGQLGIMDLIVSILIAELVAISIENHDQSMLMSLLPISLLIIFEILLAYLSMKTTKIRNILDGKPSVIIKDGKLNFKEMTKQRYNLDDLLTQLREKGVKTIEEVEHAVLESSGKLSIFKYEDNNKKTPIPMPLILDGQIQKDTLKDLNKTDKWLFNIIEKKNVKLNNIFYAFYQDSKTFIIKKSEIT